MALDLNDLESKARAYAKATKAHSNWAQIDYYRSIEDPSIILALIERLRVAERDAARLDFLDAMNAPFRMGWDAGLAPAGNVSIRSVIQLGRSLTPIREAIDRAIAERKESK